MKFKVLSDALKPALTHLARIARGRKTLPILHNIYVEAQESTVRLFMTDLTNSMSIEIGAKVDEQGAACFDFATLNDFVKLLPEMSHVSLEAKDEHKTLVKYKKGSGKWTRATIKGVDPEDMPIPSTPVAKRLFCISKDELINAFNALEKTYSREDSRPILTGCYIDVHQRFFATADGYRLTLINDVFDAQNLFAENGVTIVMTGHTMSILRAMAKDMNDDKLIDVFHHEKNDTISFDFGFGKTSCNTIDGRYPDVKAIIPSQTNNSITVYSEDLLSGLSRAMIFAKDSANSIRLEPVPSVDSAPGQLSIVGISPERGDANTTLDAEIHLDTLANAYLDGRYLKDAINSLNSERTTIRYQGEETPLLLSDPSNDNLTIVIMPMKR